jgi:transposase-like protein
MAQLTYPRHRFPALIIQPAIWLYLRFTLSYRDVEDLLAERGLDISYETPLTRFLRPSRRADQATIVSARSAQKIVLIERSTSGGKAFFRDSVGGLIPATEL